MTGDNTVACGDGTNRNFHPYPNPLHPSDDLGYVYAYDTRVTGQRHRGLLSVNGTTVRAWFVAHGKHAHLIPNIELQRLRLVPDIEEQT